MSSRAHHASRTHRPKHRAGGPHLLCEDGDLAVFVSGDQGGKTMTILLSFVASCDPVKVDPFAWFADVLSRIEPHSIQCGSTKRGTKVAE